MNQSTSLFKQFDFPLNVYAIALFLEEGRVDYLHYGLAESGGEPAWQAQQRSTDLILSRLPDSQCRLLEVGIGLGTTFLKLERLGHEVTGITPDSHQIDVVRTLAGEHASLIHTRFEDIKPDSGPYDLILMQESAQYINTLDLFNQAYNLLVDGGELLILDEVTLHSTKEESENLPILAYVVAIAERCGFELIEKIDLSSKAAPTLDYLLETMEKHKDEIKHELSLSEEAFAALIASNRAYKQNYSDGVYGYVFLRFGKVKLPRWQLSLGHSQNMPAVQCLFRSVFNQEMSSDMWYWKYGEDRGQEILAWRKGCLVAHYGGMTKRIMFFGEEKLACQIGDVMVDSKERCAFTKMGPFFLTAVCYPELFTGFGARHLVGYGFPNSRHMKLAEKLGLYRSVGSMVDIQWEKLPAHPRFLSRIRHIDPARDMCHVDSLWKAMSRDFQDALIGVRDWHFVEHRYISHPTKKYEVILVCSRIKSVPMGILVLNREGEQLELVDVIAPLSSIPLLIVQARRLAGCWKFNELHCWITKNFSQIFVQTDGREFSTEIQIPTSIWTNGPDPSAIREHWWLMAGDTDFR